MSKQSELDEILETLVTGVEADPQHIEDEVAYTKQAILRWVADEVIGEDDSVRLEHSDSAMTKKGERNLVRHGQRKILAQHGYRGE